MIFSLAFYGIFVAFYLVNRGWLVGWLVGRWLTGCLSVRLPLCRTVYGRVRATNRPTAQPSGDRR